MIFVCIKFVFYELLIYLKYAVLPTVIMLLLSYAHWKYVMLVSFVKFFILIHLVHKEDQKTGMLHFRFLLVKIGIAVLVMYLTYLGAVKVDNTYLPDSMASYREGLTKVKGMKSKVKSMLTTRGAKDKTAKLKYFGFRVLFEYLYMINVIAQYRTTYLILVFIFYGTYHLVVLYYFPEKREGDDDSQSSSSGSEIDKDEILEIKARTFKS